MEGKQCLPEQSKHEKRYFRFFLSVLDNQLYHTPCDKYRLLTYTRVLNKTIKAQPSTHTTHVCTHAHTCTHTHTHVHTSVFKILVRNGASLFLESNRVTKTSASSSYNKPIHKIQCEVPFGFIDLLPNYQARWH